MITNLAIVLVLLLLSFVPANSSEITNGSVRIPSSFGFVPFLMNFSGTNFEVSASGNNLFAPAFAPCTPSGVFCTAGSVFNLSAQSGQWDFSDLSGTMIIDGTQYFFVNDPSPTPPNLAGSGFLSFTGASVMIPFGDAPTVTLRAPFTMNGFLSGRAGVFAVGLNPLSGSGTAFLVLHSSVSGGQQIYLLDSLSYRFGAPVTVDIKPGEEPNKINLRSRGTVPVAILSTPTFDASTVNPLSVTVAEAAVNLKPNGTFASSLQDVNGDGLLDMVIHISIPTLQLTNFATEVLVEGMTFDGKYFWGTDNVVVFQRQP